MKKPKPEQQAQIIEHALRLLTETLPRHTDDPYSCIRNSRTLHDVLGALGLDAEPFPCRVAIFNPPAARLLEAEGHVPNDPEGIARWQEAGAYFLSVPSPEPLPGKYNGHLILRVEGRWLVDAAIQQAHRPEKGIALTEPLLIEIPKSQRRQTGWRLQGPGACLMWISRDDSLRGYGGITYAECPGWQRSPGWNRLTEAIIAAIRVRQKRS